METNKNKKEKLEKTGITVCTGWQRGCFNEASDGYKKCLECREAERIKEKNLRNKKTENSTNYNEANKEDKMCKICNAIESIKIFDMETMKCSDCSVKSKLSCKLRNPRDKAKGKLYDYKRSAKTRNLAFELSDEEFLELVMQPCHYCEYNDSVIGVDRKDSSKGYIKSNVLPCCEQCNLMKHESGYNDFLSICEHISTVNKKYKGKLNDDLFHISPNGQFARFRGDAERRNISFELSREELKSIVLKPCVYCNCIGEGYYGLGAGGIDRVDSTQGYKLANCVPCCYTCNRMKLNYSKTDFIVQCVKITMKSNTDNTLENEILDFFEKYSKDKENVKRQMPTFFHSKDFYEYRKWSGNLNDLAKIKIELEFVENSDQKDIWNYYRWKISSLKTFKPNNFIGRIICILVKDSVTQKYLGIMSLSSDIINMEDRDKAIGWSNESKITNKKLNHLMNLSTCVSIQPFGYNFNGGKLLAKLAFSKEVIDKFYEKFNQNLLAIVTTGLYGKSVQYDRLDEIKYVGKTKGNSIYWIPEDITEKCRTYLKSHHNYDTNGYKKLHVISKIISVLNLNKEDVLASNEKGIYLGFTRPDSKRFLCGKTKKIKPCKFKSAQEIFSNWMNRWAIQRFTHLSNQNKIESNNYNKSTERTSRHKEKLKKELGEKKYKELVSIQSKKTYANKKAKINEILQDPNNTEKTTTNEKMTNYYNKIKDGNLDEDKNNNTRKTTSTERVKKHKEKLRNEIGEEKYKELVKNQNQKSYAKRNPKNNEILQDINNVLDTTTNIKTTSTERVKKHKEKLKNELGEEKYKELISIQSKKTYANKKLKNNEILQDSNNTTNKNSKVTSDNDSIKSNNTKKTTSTERVKKHKEKLKEELGDEKYKELVKNQNQKYYANKKSELNNTDDSNNTNNIVQVKKVDNTNPDKLVLPANFTHFIENSDDYFAFNKHVNKVRLTTKYKLRSANIQKEFDDFVTIVNIKFPELKIPLYKIPNVSKFQPDKQENNTQPDTITNTVKPVMPANFSICSVNNVDYIQFCKKIDGQRYQYKTKINSYDLADELNKFIDDLNSKYGLNLDPSQNKIANTNGWKTTNKIVEHSDTPEKLAQRERTQRYLEKQKESIGVDEFNKQKAQYAKTYRTNKKAPAEIEV